ncbi:MAG: hypothetical protein ACFCGT_28385, partial [Sandaracinaceae bacterium]
LPGRVQLAPLLGLGRPPPGAVPPPPRGGAATLFAALRRTHPHLADAPVDAVARFVAEPPVPTLDPEVAHHLALLGFRLADARVEGPLDVSLAPRLMGLACLFRLGVEGAYLRALSGAVAGDDAPSPMELALDPLADLGARAREGARELTEASRRALAALRRVEGALERAQAGGELGGEARRRAASERARAIDAATEAVGGALDDATARSAPNREVVDLLRRGLEVWRWAERDPQVEVWLVETAVPLGWARYKARRWEELEALLGVLVAPAEHLARRIETDPALLAYAGPCAQLYVFRAEVARSADEQMALAERALAICPTHRNGRAVLAEHLVARANEALDRAPFWRTGDAMTAAARDVRRAERLFPLLRSLEHAKARLRSMGRDVDE